jgi:Ca-activated chloride channel family protein
VFANEFGELVSVVAKDVILLIQCHDGVTPLRSLGRQAKIDGAWVEARFNQLYAGQEKYLLLELALPSDRAGSEREMVSVELRYANLHSQQQEQLRQVVRIGYTDSLERVNDSVDKAVMVAASEQIGVEMDEQAVQLKDQGDTQAASAMLRDKADYLQRQAQKYTSEKLMKQSESSREAEKAVAAPADSMDWNKARKSMRADQYSIKKQQSYK